jgi:tRNA threonylcarbamoyladenosine biosynthesis protein TsaE
MSEIALPDQAATQELGRRIADALRPGDVVALSGGLGAARPRWPARSSRRWVTRAMSRRPALPSSYDPPATRLPVVHADFYRLNHPG